jgi:TolA-binding protein
VRLLLLVLLALVGCVAGCASPPQREPAADLSPQLVIPPLPADAGAGVTAKNDPEPPAVRTPPGFELLNRDPRASVRNPRAADVIRSEIASLEQQYASAQIPSTLHQLADAYCELARVSDHTWEATVRKEAIARFETLITMFPTYNALDEAYYYLGVEREIARDLTGARRSYYDLVAKRPQSPLVPAAYFAFGEMFWNEAHADPTKYDLAEQAFKEVMKYTGAALVPDALMRLAQIYEKKGDTQKAQETWAKLKREHPQSAAAAKAP